jgi:N-methylhydantoinase B/oxoprolinase/acetone carboxylase alpha subunit
VSARETFVTICLTCELRWQQIKKAYSWFVTLAQFLDVAVFATGVCCVQMHALIEEYSLEVVQAYMAHIMRAAETAVRDMLVSFSKRKGMGEVCFHALVRARTHTHTHTHTHMLGNASVSLECELQRECACLLQIGRVYAEDQMDDGTPICLTLTIDRKTRTAEFDFSGTGPEVRSAAAACDCLRTHVVSGDCRCWATAMHLQL